MWGRRYGETLCQLICGALCGLDGQIDLVVDGPFNSNKKQQGSKGQKHTIIFADANDKNN